ncbi:MAG: DUF4845 domain-containing protein [Proteobacteria bacterium]|nr:DUF4845 domain-containing protein [Pseudomonadota bacterium]
MRTPKGQQGITFMGFVIVMIVIGFFAYMAMRLIPMYSEFASIKKGLDATMQDPAINNMDDYHMRDAISRHFEVSYVDSIDPTVKTFPNGIVIKRTQEGLSFSVNYDARKPLFYNIFLVGHFEYTATNASTGKPIPGGG